MAKERYAVTAEALNVRAEPSIHGKVIKILKRDDVVERLSVSGDDYWFKIRTPDPTEGWASHKYLRRVTGTPSGAPAWLSIAIAEKGTHEFPGDGDNPRIVEYLHSTNLGGSAWDNDETFWCSAFVNWCFERAGFEGTDSAWARSWLNWGRKVTKPVVGCVTVFSRGSGGHVAFYLGEADGMIRVLGGNQSDAVCEANYPSDRLLGYRLPGKT